MIGFKFLNRTDTRRISIKKPLLIELAECFLKEYLQYFYDIFLSKI